MEVNLLLPSMVEACFTSKRITMKKDFIDDAWLSGYKYGYIDGKTDQRLVEMERRDKALARKKTKPSPRSQPRRSIAKRK